MFRLDVRIECHPVSIPTEQHQIKLTQMFTGPKPTLHPGRLSKLLESALERSNGYWILSGRLYKVLSIDTHVLVESVPFMTKDQVDACNEAILWVDAQIKEEEENGIHGSIFWCALRRRSLRTSFKPPRFARLPNDLPVDAIDRALDAADELLNACHVESCAQLFECLNIYNKQDCDRATILCWEAWESGITGDALVKVCRNGIITDPVLTL